MIVTPELALSAALFTLASALTLALLLRTAMQRRLPPSPRGRRVKGDRHQAFPHLLRHEPPDGDGPAKSTPGWEMAA